MDNERSSPHIRVCLGRVWLWHHLPTSNTGASPPVSSPFADQASPLVQQNDRKHELCGSLVQGSSQPWFCLGGSALWSVEISKRIRYGLSVCSHFTQNHSYCTWETKLLTSDGGSCCALPATSPLRRFLTDTFLMLKPTLWPGKAVWSPWWCISIDLTSAVNFAGEKVRTIPGFKTPVSILPTGTVPTPG